MTSLRFQLGVPEHFVDDAVALFDQAFASKLIAAIPENQARLSFLKASLDPRWIIAAIDKQKLLGIVALKAKKFSALDNISLSGLNRSLGLLKGMRALCVFSLYNVKVDDRDIWVDAIAVDADARGMGVGTGLLDFVKNHAKKQDFSAVKLGVIDTNPSAQKLYEREGFKVEKVESFEFLRGFLGFGESTTMKFGL